MKFTINKKAAFFIFIFALLALAFFALSKFISIKMKKDIFQKTDFYKIIFPNSYENIKIPYKDEEIAFHYIKGDSQSDCILYVAGKSGVLPNILNSGIVGKSVFILNYPSSNKLQNFQDLTEILKIAVSEAEKRGVNSKQIILFGEGIGGNVVLSYSENKQFRAVLMLNAFLDERRHCAYTFSSILCKMVNPTFSIEGKNNNPVYFFFNEASERNVDENYQIFNSINSDEKVIFEIPGKDSNFNFNHIIQFYSNTLLEGKIFEYNLNAEEVQNSEDLLNNDGLLNSDEYFD